MINPYAVILCGGSGSRLWPLSRSLKPKQLLALNGSETLLQQSAHRLLARVSPEHLLTVTHEDHKFEVKGQLAEINPALLQGVLAEPIARNTLPAIAWAVSVIQRQDTDAIIGVFPSDHAIGNETAFLAAWETAEKAAAQGYLSLIGITPTKPATGYGYIQPGDALMADQPQGATSVVRFVEKPNRSDAILFLEHGYLWNSGMFIFHAGRFMQMLEKFQPEIYKTITSIQDDNLAESYARLPNISIDYGLAEKADKIAVVPANMDWSDLGNWDSIYARHPKDDKGNLVCGDVVSMDTSDCLLWSTHGLLTTIGLSDIAVIQTPDATLVCDRSRTEEIKRLVATLQQSHAQITETHCTVYRPWGTYTVLEERLNFKIKRIVVNPSASLSMQLHHQRSEHWVVVSGMARITNGEQEILLEENESTYIPKGQRHRLQNPGKEPLHIIEVQCGDYVGEDDIVRFQDSYGRGS